jgi:hypothetical protein
MSARDEFDYTSADVIRNRPRETRDVFEAGVRQAITWLRADYPYGDGPQWREDGCEWIADRLADWRREVTRD